MEKTQTVTIRKLVIDSEIQQRCAILRPFVEDYAAQMREKQDKFPPIDVFVNDKGAHFLADGFHRVEAAKLVGRKKIEAILHQGDRRDAKLFSAISNGTHGLPRSSKDKQRAVGTLLGDSECGKWSDRKIAKRCHVSHTFVSNLRAELSPTSSPESRKVQRGNQEYDMKMPRGLKQAADNRLGDYLDKSVRDQQDRMKWDTEHPEPDAVPLQSVEDSGSKVICAEPQVIDAGQTLVQQVKDLWHKATPAEQEQIKIFVLYNSAPKGT